MSQYLQYIVFLGAAVQLGGVISYMKKTIKGSTKPNRVTWLLWSIAPLIATFAAISDGVTLSVLPVFMSGFGPFLVLLSSFVNKKSYWKLEKFDYLCGISSVLALILWWLTKEPSIAIIFAILSDGFAAVPTLTKSWKYPETESIVPYTTGIFNALTSFAAIKMWTFSEIAFPIYLVIVGSTLSLVILRKRFKRDNKEIKNFKKMIKNIVNKAKILKNKYTDEISAPVNYVCIFSQSENEYKIFKDLAGQIGKIIKNTETGPIYLIKRIKTNAGLLKILKIRIPDQTRKERGDADFTVSNYQSFKNKYIDKKNFRLIERPEMEMIELMESGYDVRVYFSHPTIEQQYL